MTAGARPLLIGLRQFEPDNSSDADCSPAKLASSRVYGSTNGSKETNTSLGKSENEHQTSGPLPEKEERREYQ